MLFVGLWLVCVVDVIYFKILDSREVKYVVNMVVYFLFCYFLEK